MKNVKSTTAMKLAHTIAKRYPRATFKACLIMAWKIVRIDSTIAKRILDGTYTFTFIRSYNATFGNITVMPVKEKGFKAAIKRFLKGRKADYVFSRYAF